MQKALLALASLVLLGIAGCGASNLKELKGSPEIHDSYTVDAPYMTVYQRIDAMLSNDGYLPLRRSMVYADSGEAVIEQSTLYGMSIHISVKSIAAEETRVDVYSAHKMRVWRDVVDAVKSAAYGKKE